MILTYNKQRLSNTWSSIHEKVKQHRLSWKKTLLIKKSVYTPWTRKPEVNFEHIQFISLVFLCHTLSEYLLTRNIVTPEHNKYLFKLRTHACLTNTYFLYIGF